ncbi:hypothetical protein acsn021_24930 [Anaerocolumna cellulosilytica]|uniref:Uncharacterized protein n=1 Tax=Anaerocolumna cellulosilytica TaxID=433286 RepID=A0A6S6QWC7_9FIRM|nr:hypothetical protein [Anaerocolumna cellulosilytica]MBB5193860.1 outer membrane murein-binding lipoprotein Lpp [Anaerocolumna cellulosilytica]BCJ94924.1 hypothetical protein acsn021_24930 [Anaerocolumna cellulosilytica]
MKKQVGLLIILSITLLLWGCSNQAKIHSENTELLQKQDDLTAHIPVQSEETILAKEEDKKVPAVSEVVSTVEEKQLMIKYKGDIYQVSALDVDIDTNHLIKIGKVKSVVSDDKKPNKNNQANRNIKGEPIYQGEENTIIVKINEEYKLLEKQ